MPSNCDKARKYNLAQAVAPAVLHALRIRVGVESTLWPDSDVFLLSVWQSANGLTSDGMIGPRTQAALLLVGGGRSGVGGAGAVRVPLSISEARVLFGAAGSLLFFIDISTHQVVHSWARVEAACDGVIIKAGQGESGFDVSCADHVNSARMAGAKVLALYHYAQHFGHTEALSTRPSCPKKNARNLISALRLHNVRWGVLDLEPDEVARAIERGWIAADFERWSREFVAEFKQSSGERKLVVYLSGETIERSRAGARVGGFDWLRDSGIPLWWAGYLRHDAERPLTWGAPVGHLAGWPLDAAHQYRGGDNKKTKPDEGGKCDGISGDVDNNCGSRAGWVGQMLLDAV